MLKQLFITGTLIILNILLFALFIAGDKFLKEKSEENQMHNLIIAITVFSCAIIAMFLFAGFIMQMFKP